MKKDEDVRCRSTSQTLWSLRTPEILCWWRSGSLASAQRVLSLFCNQISSSYDPGNAQNLYETAKRKQKFSNSLPQINLLYSIRCIPTGRYHALSRSVWPYKCIQFLIFSGKHFFPKTSTNQISSNQFQINLKSDLCHFHTQGKIS